MIRSLRIAAAGALTALLVPAAGAQQFDLDHALPGGFVWSEGLEAADVDNDGDLDLFVADGEGFSTPGLKRQNTLHRNELVETGSLSWRDESVLRLGVHESNAKMVVTGDLDADGWIDALFANAFNTDLPFLYMNQGAANPGFFDFDGVNRGLTDVLSSADAALGDIENDGDLDIVLADSGNSFLGGAGGVPHVYRNDGTAHFTLDTAATASIPNEQGHMDVHLVDIDNDWDLDLWVATHETTHLLLLNDGDGIFSNASGLIPTTSSNVYEADVADLDGDTDMDMFFISLTSFSEGPLRNDLIPSGSLSFVKGAVATQSDDNEVSFCDFDNDGDLDAFIGSLTNNTEKLRVNDGGLNFSGGNMEITNFSDPTLDCTHADVDNDGDYDFLTANGETSGGHWANKVYLNTGAPDVLPPVVQRQETLDDCQDVAGPWVVRAVVQDQVRDDGKDWLSARVLYDVDGNAGDADGLRTGVGMYRFEMEDTAAGLGTLLTWQLELTDYAGNVTLTAPDSVCLCGFGSYGPGGMGGTFHALTLAGGGAPEVGGSVDLTTTGVPPGATAVVTLVSLDDASIPGFLGGTLLVDPLLLVDPVLLAIPAGGTAVASAPIPNLPPLAGVGVYFQSISDDDGLPFFNRLSNGLRLTICP